MTTLKIGYDYDGVRGHEEEEQVENWRWRRIGGEEEEEVRRGGRRGEEERRVRK